MYLSFVISLEALNPALESICFITSGSLPFASIYILLACASDITSKVLFLSSSYARKYALNGLFAIDDTKDSDFTNTHNKEDKKKTLEVISEAQAKRMYMLAKGKDTNMVKQILANYGFNESRDITKDKYNYICEQIEAI